MRHFPQKPPLGVPVNWGDPLARDLVYCGLFNEGTGNKVYDQTGHGVTGTITDGTWIGGKQGSALNFNGTSTYVDLGTSTFGAPSEFTFVSFVNTASIGGARVAQRDANYYPFGFVCDGAGSTFSLGFKVDGDANYYSTLSNNVPAGWNQVGFVFSVTSKRIFVNGQFSGAGSTQAGAPYWNGARSLCLGRRPSSTGWWTGPMSFAMIYNRALSPSEVEQLYMTPFRMFGEGF